MRRSPRRTPRRVSAPSSLPGGRKSKNWRRGRSRTDRGRSRKGPPHTRGGAVGCTPAARPVHTGTGATGPPHTRGGAVGCTSAARPVHTIAGAAGPPHTRGGAVGCTPAARPVHTSTGAAGPPHTRGGTADKVFGPTASRHRPTAVTRRALAAQDAAAATAIAMRWTREHHTRRSHRRGQSSPSAAIARNAHEQHTRRSCSHRPPARRRFARWGRHR